MFLKGLFQGHGVNLMRVSSPTEHHIAQHSTTVHDTNVII